MNSKSVIVTLKLGEPFTTVATKVTYLNWGIRFVTDDDRSIIYIPWDNIAQIKEIIS